MNTSEHAVAILGAGPTGLMLAAELALAGIDVAVIERRADQALAGSRAGGLHARTLEILDQRGIVERFLAQGQIAQVAGFGGIRLDLSDFPTRHPYGLGLWQNRIEGLLAQWVDELPVRWYRACEAVALAQDETGVELELIDGRRVRAQYAVGCDGGRSLVRKAAGIEFRGWDASVSSLIAQLETREEPELGVRRTASGTHAIGKVDYTIEDGRVVYEPGGTVGVVLTEARLPDAAASDPRAGEPTLEDVRERMIEVFGTDYGAHSPSWISRFTDMARQAASYRAGRVLLAGDAAHVHSPVGGQGLNLGVHDAVNLGWKLALVVAGKAPQSLLDSYHAERHPVAARVLRDTLAQIALMRVDDRIDALREIVADLLGIDEARKRWAASMSGLGLRYDFGDGHPLLGRRMPDLDLDTADGPRRAYALLHQARALLLDFGAAGGLDIAPWSDRVLHIEARYAGAWELPVVGAVAAPAAVLVRPDGYVAWVGDGSARGLADALEHWFGPPAAAH